MQGDGKKEKTENFRDWFLDSDRTFELRKGNPQSQRRRFREDRKSGDERGVAEVRGDKEQLSGRGGEISQQWARSGTKLRRGRHKENVSRGKFGSFLSLWAEVDDR
jgi:hypothetical protein